MDLEGVLLILAALATVTVVVSVPIIIANTVQYIIFAHYKKNESYSPIVTQQEHRAIARRGCRILRKWVMMHDIRYIERYTARMPINLTGARSRDSNR
jgi:hypothetical protein